MADYMLRRSTEGDEVRAEYLQAQSNSNSIFEIRELKAIANSRFREMRWLN